MSEENTYKFLADQRMFEASETARKNFKYFWRELSWEYRRIIPGLDLAVVKVPFQTHSDDPDVPFYEHMWISDISFDGEIITGYLVNEPNWVKHLHAGDIISVPLAKISDWLYVSQGKAFGGFSIQAMRKAMDSFERKQHDATWGFAFGDPHKVEVTPYAGKEPGFTSNVSPFKQPGAEASTVYPEHPMSENMAENIEQQLKAQPSIVSMKDDEGWSMLHREALAGNLTPIKLLLKYGADPLETNGAGDNAIDLAMKLGWSRIIEELSGKS